MKLIDKIELLQEVKSQFGNEVNCDEIISKLKSNKFKCPKCHGCGKTYERYNAYPSGLPDSGWVEDWKYKEVECDLCKGEGYTDHEYKPRMVQDGWE